MKKEKKFRLRGKKLFLTYPQLDKSIEFIKEKTLEQLKEKLKHIEYYLIGEEKHEDGGIHLHCFLELRVSFDTSDVHSLDLIFDKVKYHGNYQIGKKKNSIIEYIIKDCNFITNLILAHKNGKLLKPTEHLYNVCLEHGYHKAKDLLYSGYPDIAIKKGGTLLKNLNEFSEYLVQKNSHKIEKQNIFNLEDFDMLKPDIFTKIINWLKEGCYQGFKVTLILHGPAGTGKTQLAKSIFKFLNIDYLTISEINDFKNYDSSRHKGILIDDLDAESLTRINTLNIVDSSDGKSIRVLYGIVTPKPLIPRIITTNRLKDFTKNGTNELLRRLKDIYIPEKISSKFNIQINIQNNISYSSSCNNYFGDNLGISKEELNKYIIKIKEYIEKKE